MDSQCFISTAARLRRIRHKGSWGNTTQPGSLDADVPRQPTIQDSTFKDAISCMFSMVSGRIGEGVSSGSGVFVFVFALFCF